MAQRQATQSENATMADSLNRVVFVANRELIDVMRGRLQGEPERIAFLNMVQRDPNIDNMTLLFDFLNRTGMSPAERQSLAGSIMGNSRTNDLLFEQLPFGVRRFLDENYFHRDMNRAFTDFLDDCRQAGMSPRQVRAVLTAATTGAPELRMGRMREALAGFMERLSPEHRSVLFLSRLRSMSTEEQESMERHMRGIETVGSGQPLRRQ